MSTTPNQQPVFKVIRLMKLASTQPNRLGKMDAFVTYSVNGRGSNTIIIPSENLTEQNIKTAIKDDYQKHAKLATLEFT